MGSGGDFFHIRQCGIFAMTRHVDTSGNVRNHKNTWCNAITNEPATMGFQAKFTQVTKTSHHHHYHHHHHHHHYHHHHHRHHRRRHCRRGLRPRPTRRVMSV